MIVDLERRMVVDILGDRSVASAARWLERHPSVEIVSRNRCGLYAQAAREGAPQARQVTDRFHLMQNLRVAVDEPFRPRHGTSIAAGQRYRKRANRSDSG
ncbi:transposase [Sinorhizobium meliloti]|uniref:transposase n=1 Tax=Rhizobium meliloti TaxID=382 RepID=UPI003B52DB20